VFQAQNAKHQKVIGLIEILGPYAIGLRCRCALNFYARKQILLSARLSHRNSVCLSVCPSVCLSVCHTGGSVKNGAS